MILNKLGNTHWQVLVPRKLPPKRTLFQTTLFFDGIPAYYGVTREGIKFNYSPSYENLIDPLPLFTIWNDGFDWFIDTPDLNRLDAETINLAIKKIDTHLRS